MLPPPPPHVVREEEEEEEEEEESRTPRRIGPVVWKRRWDYHPIGYPSTHYSYKSWLIR